MASATSGRQKGSGSSPVVSSSLTTTLSEQEAELGLMRLVVQNVSQCGEHRYCGDRSWCHDCGEWCYRWHPDAEGAVVGRSMDDMACIGCLAVRARTALAERTPEDD